MECSSPSIEANKTHYRYSCGGTTPLPYQYMYIQEYRMYSKVAGQYGTDGGRGYGGILEAELLEVIRAKVIIVFLLA
jgi:hypothetical protein